MRLLLLKTNASTAIRVSILEALPGRYIILEVKEEEVPLPNSWPVNFLRVSVQEIS